MRILVSLRYDGGIAAVYRDADGAWLGVGEAGDPASLGGTLLDTRPARVGIGGGRRAVGGLLPPGASKAVVEGIRATTGNGAWVAIIDDAGLGCEPAARFEAGDGTIVRPELPAAYAREPVSDADEPCPACGALTWERVTPIDDSRGTQGPHGGPMRPSPVIVCSRCGHEVAEGAWYGVGPDLGLLSSPRRLLRALRRRKSPAPPPMPRPPLGELGFPVYVPAGAGAERAGGGWDREGVHSVTMRHDAVEVTTRAPRRAFVPADDESALALRSVVEAAEPADWGRGSPAARALRLNAHMRATAARVARAEPFAVDVPVDGEPVRFTGLRDPAGWAGAADTADARIVIAARIAPDAVALRREGT